MGRKQELEVCEMQVGSRWKAENEERRKQFIVGAYPALQSGSKESSTWMGPVGLRWAEAFVFLEEFCFLEK